jgi:hypothetical protein
VGQAGEVVAMTLTEFLLARIADDEALAKLVIAGHWRARLFNGEFLVIDAEDGEVVCVLPFDDMANQHIARWDPARVLAECKAKRAIVEGMAPFGPIDDIAAPEILGILAEPYADHPDYREEWRP